MKMGTDKYCLIISSNGISFFFDLNLNSSLLLTLGNSRQQISVQNIFKVKNLRKMLIA